jgi:hypothetical protein
VDPDVNSTGPDSLPSAFVVVVAAPGCRLADEVITGVGGTDPPFWFEPDSRYGWVDDDRRTLVAVWQRRGAVLGDRWHDVDGELAVTTGRLRRVGAPWSSPSSWAEELGARLRLERVENVVDSLTGAFHLLTLDRTGAGSLAADALGQAFTYHGSNDDVQVFSSEAVLAAGALAGSGPRPARDPVASSWLGYTPYHIGLDTGYAGVSLLREGTVVRFDGGPPRLEGRPAPWLTPGPLSRVGHEGLLDRIVDAITDELQAASNLDADEWVIDLTGGKDSRLMLAVALLAGIAGRFSFMTVGPESLGDVRVARQVADEFGLDHRWGIDRHAPHDDPYPGRARRFTEATTGLVSMWHAKSAGPDTGRVRVSGSFAEVLRTHQPVAGTPPDAHVLAARQVRRFESRAMPLLDADLVARFGERVLAEFTDDPTGGAPPLDVLETFFARNRTRKFWGPMLSMERDQRIWPLVNRETVGAAFAIGGHDRQLERVHYDIIRRASPRLVDMPFAGPGWARELTGEPDPVPTSPDPAGDAARAVRPTPTPGTVGNEPLITMLRRTSAGERDAFLHELVEDRTNPAWELIDRAATAGALAQWGELPARHRQQVYGVLTAALWLGDDPRSSGD